MDKDKIKIIAIREFSDCVAKLGAARVRELIQSETGHLPARSTIYDVAVGKGKEGNIILLNYALKNAVAKLNS